MQLNLKSKLKIIIAFLALVLSIFLVNTPKSYALKLDPEADPEFVNYYDYQFIAQWNGETSHEGTGLDRVKLTIIDAFGLDHLEGLGFWFYQNYDFAFDWNLNTPEWGDKFIWTAFDGPYGLWEKYVEPDKQPVLSGETAFVTTIDNPISINDIMSRIEAIDNEDGNITHLIQIDNTKTTYNENVSIIGNYELHLYVEDSAGNRAELIVHVLVKDITEPVISGKSSYNQSYTKKLDVNTVLNALSVSDNYDSSVTVKVKEDNYSANYNKIGSYEIIFNAVDSSGNEGIYIVTINVIDDVAPVFTAPETILKGQSETLTLNDILDQVTVNDFIDNSVSFTVYEDNYTGKGHMVGNWTIVLEAIDNSNNRSVHIITIQVRDNIPPVFYVDNFFIHVDDIVHLTRQDIIDLLVASGQLEINATTTFSFPLNEYEGNENIPGIYALTVKSSSIDGTSKQVSLAIKVYETEDNDDIILDPEKNIFEKIWDFFKKTWDWLFEPINDNSKFLNVYYILIPVGIIIVISFVSSFVGINKSRRFRYRRKQRRYRR